MSLVCAALGLPGSSVSVTAAERPNIVLIIIDTLRADRLGAYGYRSPTSPEIDSLAQNGVRFERVISQSTWTRPSIASLLTSLHPRTLGLSVEEEHALNPRHQTLAEVLKDHGYWTAGATANPNTNATFNFDQGYDYYLGTKQLWRTGYAKHKVGARDFARTYKGNDFRNSAFPVVRRLRRGEASRNLGKVESPSRRNRRTPS